MSGPPRMARRYGRELAAGAAYVALLLALAVAAPRFFTAANLRDLAVDNAAVAIVAAGMTLIIVAGQIDVSVGAQFAVCSVVTGWLAKAGVPAPALLPAVALVGALLGLVNGALIGRLGLPSIVVTLATMAVWHDLLGWITEGTWIQDLPYDFQWFGLGQARGEIAILVATLGLVAACAWAMRHLGVGRMIYAVGADPESARLAGISPRRVTTGVFVVMGALVGVAAAANAARFPTIPANAGSGLELEAIAAVVVGGAAITGGCGRVLGSMLGVALLGTLGTALTFGGVSPYWQRALQGAVILAALGVDVLLSRLDALSVDGLRARADAR